MSNGGAALLQLQLKKYQILNLKQFKSSVSVLFDCTLCSHVYEYLYIVFSFLGSKI